MRTVIAIVLLAALTLSGCGGKPTNVNSNSTANANESSIKVDPNPPTPKSQADPGYVSCNPYFPLKPGSKLTYSVNQPGGLTYRVTVVVDEIQENGRKVYVENTHSIDEQTKGFEYLQLQEKKYACDGERVLILVDRSTTQVRENRSIVTTNYSPNTICMPDPASLSRAGFTWTQNYTQVQQFGDQPPTNNNEIGIVAIQVLGEENASTKAGNFKAVKIKRTVGTTEIFEWYVKELGLVKRESSQGVFWDLVTYQGVTPEQAR